MRGEDSNFVGLHPIETVVGHQVGTGKEERAVLSAAGM